MSSVLERILIERLNEVNIELDAMSRDNWLSVVRVRLEKEREDLVRQLDELDG